MLNNLPVDYIENEYNKLFNTLTFEINEKMNHYDFKNLSLIFDRLKYITKKILYSKSILNKLNEIEQYKKILDFIENEKVDTELK